MCAFVCCWQELVVALSGFVCQFETQFASIAYQLSEVEKDREYHTVTGTVGVWNSPNGPYALSTFYRNTDIRHTFNGLSPGQPG